MFNSWQKAMGVPFWKRYTSTNFILILVLSYPVSSVAIDLDKYWDVHNWYDVYFFLLFIMGCVFTGIVIVSLFSSRFTNIDLTNHLKIHKIISEDPDLDHFGGFSLARGFMVIILLESVWKRMA